MDSVSKYGSNVLKDGNSVEVLTGAWKNRKPIHLKDKCKHCMLCVPYCPDNCIIQENNILQGFDLNYCKGCGVCAKVCPFSAIEMKLED